MSRFIKLSNRIINTALIKRVDFTEPDKYVVYFANNYFNTIGYYNKQFYETDCIIACKKEHPESYKAIDEWIKHLPC